MKENEMREREKERGQRKRENCNTDQMQITNSQ